MTKRAEVTHESTFNLALCVSDYLESGFEVMEVSVPGGHFQFHDSDTGKTFQVTVVELVEVDIPSSKAVTVTPAPKAIEDIVVVSYPFDSQNYKWHRLGRNGFTKCGLATNLMTKHMFRGEVKPEDLCGRCERWS